MTKSKTNVNLNIFRKYKLESALRDMSWLIKSAKIAERNSHAVSSMRISMVRT